MGRNKQGKTQYERESTQTYQFRWGVQKGLRLGHLFLQAESGSPELFLENRRVTTNKIVHG